MSATTWVVTSIEFMLDLLRKSWDLVNSFICRVLYGNFISAVSTTASVTTATIATTTELNRDYLLIQKIFQEPIEKIINKDEELEWRKKNLETFIINNGDLQKTNKSLGQGGFGHVYIGYYRNNEVAVKVIASKEYKNASFPDVENELLVMKYLGAYPTLLTCYGYTRSAACIEIVLELSPFGALSKILYNHESIPEIMPSLMLAWLCDISDALQYIHKKKVKHRDIKAENCLVFNMFRIKLCDFGLAKEHHTHLSSSVVGTLPFLAPEIRLGRGSFYASDIYSFAMTAAQILTRKRLDVRDNNNNVITEAVANMKGVDKTQLLDLLLQCINGEIEKRPSAEAVYDKCLAILEANGGDPRKIGDDMHPSIAAMQSILSPTSEGKHILPSKQMLITNDSSSTMSVSLSSLNSEDAVKLLIWLGCCRDLAHRIESQTEVIDGEYLVNIDSVDTLQALESNDSATRKPKLNSILKKLKDLSNGKLSRGVLDIIRQGSMSERINGNTNSSVILTENSTRVGNIMEASSMLSMKRVNEPVIVDGSLQPSSGIVIPKPLEDQSPKSVTKDIYANVLDIMATYDAIELTNETIQTAVELWFAERDAAMSQYGHISTWNTSKVTNMRVLFQDKTEFNDDISQWNVSNVTDMWSMFRNCSNFNQCLNNWNVSNVTNVSMMFYNATMYNQPLNNWNTTKVTSMSCMFNGACCFNQPLSSWDVSNVTDMAFLFNNATNFNQSVDGWKPTKLKHKASMFDDCIRFTDTSVRPKWYNVESSPSFVI